MNEFAVSLLVALARTTLLLAAAAVVVRAILGATGCSSPKAHRAAWVLVLLQGWLFLRLTVPIPYHEMPHREIPLRGAPAMSDLVGEAPPDVTPRVATATPAPIVPEHESAVFAGKVSPVDAARTSRADVPRSPSPVWRAWATFAGQNWPSLLLGAWLAGMGTLVIRALVRYIMFVRRLPPARPAEDAWVRQWEALLAEEGIRRPVRLRMTASVGPVLCRLPSGWQLLLPVDLWQGLTPAGRLSVLRHELAHLKRGDAWKSLLARLLALPHWFNPAAWWAVRKFEEAAEWACDGAATGADRRQAVEYARTLVHLGTPLTRHLACGPAARGHGLSVRVRRLLSPGTKEDSIMKKLLVITIALGLVVVCLLRFDLVAKEPPTGRSAPGQVGIVRETIVAPEAPDSLSEPSPPVPMGGSMMGMSAAMEGAEMMGGAGEMMEGTMGMWAPAEFGGGMEMMSGAPKSTSRAATKLPLKSLRYDGKSFEEWKNEWKTELKPERRAEAINAFAAFGANGYGEEAAEAILEVMRGLEMEITDADFSKSSFQKGSYAGTRLVKMSAIAGFLDVRPDYRIPPEDAVKVLSRELKTGNRNGRMFAIFALQNMGYEAEAAIPALLETFERDEDPTVRCCAYNALAAMGAGFPMSPSALRELMEKAEPDALRSILGTLVPHPGMGGSPSASIFQEKPSPTSHVMPSYGMASGMDDYGGSMMGGGMPSYVPHSGPPRQLRPNAEPIVETLIEALDSQNAAARSQAIQALGRIGPEVEAVVPALVRAFEKGTAADRQMIFQTLEGFARERPQTIAGMGMPGPGQYVEFEEPDLSAIDAKEVIPKLIGALDPRAPADLGLMGQIYARFGPLVPEVIPILEKAAKDENEEVCGAATQVLEAITGPGRRRGR